MSQIPDLPKMDSNSPREQERAALIFAASALALAATRTQSPGLRMQLLKLRDEMSERAMPRRRISPRDVPWTN